MTRKRILIYGDSNTYGYDAEDGGRFDQNTRWPDVCQALLGEQYTIIAEGLNGRNTCHDDPMDPLRNGLAYVKAHVIPHLPLDAICVKLGSNDLDAALRQTPEMIAENAARVLKKARQTAEKKRPKHPCQYVLMAPLEITEAVFDGPFWPFYDDHIVETSKKVAAAFERQAERDGFLFFNANEHARCGSIDGVHLDAENHRKMGVAFAEWIKEHL